MENNLIFAFALTLFAGLATGIGSLIALFAKRTNTKFLSVSLGFSAGVMVYVSMVELFAESKNTLIAVHGDKLGSWAAVFSFFAGIALIALIDKFVPDYENPHELHAVEEMENPNLQNHHHDKKLMRTGLVTALVLAIHNFPEGIATFMSGLQDASVGIPVAVAVAIHNIPEGIAVSVPIFYATGDRKKAFKFSFLSGLAEPLGAVIAFLVLRPFMSVTLNGIIFAAVAGIMVFISLDELLPSAHEYGEHHLAIYGFISGMAVMAVSLLLFI